MKKFNYEYKYGLNKCISLEFYQDLTKIWYISPPPIKDKEIIINYVIK